MTTYSTDTLDNTEPLAILITRDDYARGRIDHQELERRLHAIIGLAGPAERARVLHTAEIVDITVFGDRTSRFLPTAWEWPS